MFSFNITCASECPAGMLKKLSMPVILKIDGVSVFQWFHDMARKLLQKMGVHQPQPRQGKGLHH